MLPLAMVLAISLAPPLSEQEQRDLATAADGSEYSEQAFYSLVQSIRAWPASGAESDDEPIRLTPDWQTMLERPGDFRGDLCRVEGELLQQTSLPPPYEDVREWFVRDARSKQPVILYIVRSNVDRPFGPHDRVQVDARFYKRMHFKARDKQEHDYPALVGRFPQAGIAPVSATSASTSQATPNRTADRLWLLAGIIVMLLVLLVVLRVWIARGRRVASAASHVPLRLRKSGDWPAMDAEPGLPDDPAEALAEMRRRASAPPDARDQGQPAAPQ